MLHVSLSKGLKPLQRLFAYNQVVLGSRPWHLDGLVAQMAGFLHRNELSTTMPQGISSSDETSFALSKYIGVLAAKDAWPLELVVDPIPHLQT